MVRKKKVRTQINRQIREYETIFNRAGTNSAELDDAIRSLFTTLWFVRCYL